MNPNEETDQIAYSFLFIITPLQIISTKSIKNLKKSLLLKLGDKTQKTSQLNNPIEIPVEVSYSRTLKKYCPIKGIIKVYDINSDGSEVISSVGGFQTEEILNEQKNNVIIQRDIGTSKVKMKIEIKNLGTVKCKLSSNEKQIQSTQQLKQESFRSRNRQNISESESNLVSKSRQLLTNSRNSQKSGQQNIDDQVKKQKSSNLFKRTSQTNDISSIEASKSIRFSKKDSNQSKGDNMTNESIENGLQLRFSSNKQNTALKSQNPSLKSLESKESSESNINFSQNIQSLKEKMTAYQKSRDEILFHFQNISECLQTKNGKIWSQFNEKLKTLDWKYKYKHFEKVFNDFFLFVEIQLSKPKQYLSKNQENEQNSKASQLPPQIQEKTNQKIKMLNEELTRRTSENLSLRAMQRQKGSLQVKLKSKQRQCLQFENRIKEIQSYKRALKQENIYLKQKDETLQQIILEKENEIELLKQEITEIQLQYKEMESTIKNDGCEIQELREEVSNLNETIDVYREKYGDLKNTKNRALQNQLKECLIWIDQQTRELEMSDFAEETQPSHSHNVSEIIKSIELQGASREEMNSIKVELAGLIKRIDNFLAK